VSRTTPAGSTHSTSAKPGKTNRYIHGWSAFISEARRLPPPTHDHLIAPRGLEDLTGTRRDDPLVVVAERKQSWQQATLDGGVEVQLGRVEEAGELAVRQTLRQASRGDHSLIRPSPGAAHSAGSSGSSPSSSPARSSIASNGSARTVSPRFAARAAR